MNYLILIFEKHLKSLKIVAGIIVVIITSIWAMITLVYPDLIRPLFDDIRIDIDINHSPISTTDDYSLHKIQVEIKNIGLNKVYLPSTYCLVRAFNLTTDIESTLIPDDKSTLNPEVKKVIREYIETNKNDKERRQLSAEGSNYFFNKRWEKAFSTGRYSGKLDVRSLYHYEPESELYVQLSRLTGMYGKLYPKEITNDQFMITIPSGYHIAEIICRAISSKENFDEYVFIPFYGNYGLKLFPFIKSENTTDEILNFYAETLQKNIDSGFYEEFEANFSDSIFNKQERLEFYLPEHIIAKSYNKQE